VPRTASVVTPPGAITCRGKPKTYGRDRPTVRRMSQSATKFVKDALESKVKSVDSETGESPESWESLESQESMNITRSELEAIVRDGVREGLSEYDGEAEQDEAGRGGADDAEGSDASQSDDSSSGSRGLRVLILLGLVVAAILYRRRRSGVDDNSSNH